ncbi:MAG: bifunctional 4-hydroxy-2-oxoglutarate aldolase/2-dehydro-3-deoxy-phosphogluconate aldolase [Bacteroidetes bacterium]|nr:bifunctional 4-hydroxy-2-oxoglutarate aldolase/2-dehydro-3-deoxy-phosphogluconate aldolase [Bacteroidota bacterium]MCY4205740.1 bifunctional 4-hydroxy-2-oxoglutarate aldolase/2-dehydro-3-deoxy-phosphogluconate aldolase [Bacteroidota bacterium]
MNRREKVKQIITSGAIAVLRFRKKLPLEQTVDALIRGGVKVLEITLTTPGSLSSIEALQKSHGSEILIGAGSVITEQQVQDVASAGADFVVSPVTKKEVIDSGHVRELPVIPGAFTPTEAQVAHEYGADMIKIFPAGQLGSGYLKALLAPLPNLKLVTTGGVTPENAGEWIRTGAVAVGLGSALIDVEVIQSGQFSVLTERARILCNSITEARKILPI